MHCTVAFFCCVFLERAESCETACDARLKIDEIHAQLKKCKEGEIKNDELYQQLLKNTAQVRTAIRHFLTLHSVNKTLFDAI